MRERSLPGDLEAPQLEERAAEESRGRERREDAEERGEERAPPPARLLRAGDRAAPEKQGIAIHGGDTPRRIGRRLRLPSSREGRRAPKPAFEHLGNGLLFSDIDDIGMSGPAGGVGHELPRDAGQAAFSREG